MLSLDLAGCHNIDSVDELVHVPPTQAQPQLGLTRVCGVQALCPKLYSLSLARCTSVLGSEYRGEEIDIVSTPQSTPKHKAPAHV